MNGLSLLALIGVACALGLAYRYGRIHGRRDGPAPTWLTRIAKAAPQAAGPVPPLVPRPTGAPAPAAAADFAAHAHVRGDVPADGDPPSTSLEKSRLIVAYEAEAARLGNALRREAAAAYQLDAFAEDRRSLLRETGRLRAEVARYRQVVVDLEDNAPPPILNERGMPDDLKLIVGIGPALERMLQQLGVATYRQIARWTEHDIDDMDARLPEFPGRIRRDAWVTQARQLHQNKYGERPEGR